MTNLQPPPRCPDCKTTMKRRTNSKDGTEFWGCRNFPECQQTKAMDDADRRIRKVVPEETVSSKKQLLDKALEFARACGDFYKARNILDLASQLFGEDVRTEPSLPVEEQA